MASSSHSHSSGGHGDHDHHHDHGHDHGDHDHDHSHGDTSERRLLFALALTTLFMGVEAVGGWMADSLALIADAGHMFTDAAALALAYAAVRISRRPADQKRSYGYDRMQVLAAFVNGLGLFVIAGWIVIEGLMRLVNPVAVDAPLMLGIATLGLLANAVTFFILHNGEQDNLNVRGALAHVLSDLFGSAGAILAGLVILYTGWLPADPSLSILVALLILRTGLKVTRDSAHILLEGVPAAVDLPELRASLRDTVPGLLDVHHVHVWSLTPQRRVLTLHAVLTVDSDGDEVLRQINQCLTQRFGIEHLTVQIERLRCTDNAVEPKAALHRAC